MELQIKAKHLRYPKRTKLPKGYDTLYEKDFLSLTNCPLAKALKDIHSGKIKVGCNTGTIDGKRIFFDFYGYEHFKADLLTARKKQDEEVIRIINYKLN